jgi:hypothetical protein
MKGAPDKRDFEACREALEEVYPICHENLVGAELLKKLPLLRSTIMYIPDFSF